MEWNAEGILLGVRRHGEASTILELFTKEHGRHLGVLRGGGSSKMAPHLQPGAQLQASWRARLSEHIGTYRIEPLRGRAAEVLGDRFALAGLSSICALLSFVLPERAPYPALYARTEVLLDGLGAEEWARSYLAWEQALLEEMGFGLDLSSCAVSGRSNDLVYVSPRTGRAVARDAAGEWADRLLPLPAVMLGGPGTIEDVGQGLKTTGHFLAHKLAPSLGSKPLPAARQRFVDAVARRSA